MVLFALTAFVLSSVLTVAILVIHATMMYATYVTTTILIVLVAVSMTTQRIRVARRGFVLSILSTLASTSLVITARLASPVNHLLLGSLVKTAPMSPVNHLLLVNPVKTVSTSPVNHMHPVSRANLLPLASPVNHSVRRLPHRHQVTLLKIRANSCVLAVGLVELPLKELKD
jgi:hypothetical protein